MADVSVRINVTPRRPSSPDFLYCSDCHDTYQLGNFSTTDRLYESLSMWHKQKDRFFAISSFYSEHGFLNLELVDELLTLVEGELTSLRLDRSTSLMFRINHVLEQPSVIEDRDFVIFWSIVTKLRSCDKFKIDINWRYYTDLFDDAEKIKFRRNGDSSWSWSRRISFSTFPILRINLVNVDVLFYISAFYHRYHYLNSTHLRYLICQQREPLTMMILLSKYCPSDDVSFYTKDLLLIESILEVLLRTIDPNYLHALLTRPFVNIWRRLETDRFVRIFFPVFDDLLRSTLLSRERLREECLSRIIMFNFSSISSISSESCNAVVFFFHKWMIAGFYKLAFPCSFFPSMTFVRSTVIEVINAAADPADRNLLDIMIFVRGTSLQSNSEQCAATFATLLEATREDFRTYWKKELFKCSLDCLFYGGYGQLDADLIKQLDLERASRSLPISSVQQWQSSGILSPMAALPDNFNFFRWQKAGFRAGIDNPSFLADICSFISSFVTLKSVRGEWGTEEGEKKEATVVDI